MSAKTTFHQSSKRKRVYRRGFDYDEVRRRHLAGETLAALAAEFGVSGQSIWRAALSEEDRAEHDRRCYASRERHECADCGADVIRGERCVDCSHLARRTSVRRESLWCNKCQEWKPDEDFYPTQNAKLVARRYRATFCRKCDNAARLERRRRKNFAGDKS